MCHSLLQLLGPCSVDLFATRLNNRLQRYISSRPDLFALAMECLCNILARGSRVRISTILPNRQMPTVHQEGCKVIDTCSSRVGYPTMVSRTSGPPDRIPPTIATTRAPSGESFNQGHPLVVRDQLWLATWKLLGRDIILLLQGNFGESLALIQAGWSKGTNKAYEAGWSRWLGWCVQKDPFQ